MSQLTQLVINDVLTRVSAKLRAKTDIDSSQFPMQVIVAGGAISVLHGVRISTEDIDFYCVEEKVMALIQDAAGAVANDMKLRQHFMNSDFSVYLDLPSFRNAVSRTFEQHECVFESDVLQVYAADYGYQFISKVDRMSRAVDKGRNIRRKDCLDAAFYLHELIRTRFMGRNPTLEEVVSLYPTDGSMPVVSTEILDLVTTAYQQRYGVAPFSES